MANENFYEELDLKYVEIGINMERIDRINPGKVPFNIPVLTPQVDNSRMTNSKIIQKDKSKLENLNAGAVEVSNLEMSNYIYIEVPRALLADTFEEFYIKGDLTLSGSTRGGAYSPPSTVWIDGTWRLPNGKVTLTPVNRYIPKGKRWAICFLGGDINQPFVLARLPDENT